MSEVTADQAAAAADEAAQAPTDQEKPKNEAKPTTYVILAQQNGGLWNAEENVDARSNKEAVSRFVKAHVLEEGVFVAVPARSWDPITVRTETHTRLTLS